MKQGIHPKFNSNAKVTCSCGHSFVAGSTSDDDLTTEICSNCHPFFTGQQLLVDTAGRVERYKKLTAVSTEMKSKAPTKKPRKARGQAK